MKELIEVQCILDTGYNDKELGKFIEKNDIYYVSKERARLLKEKNAVRILRGNIEETKEKQNIKTEESEKIKRKPRRKV